MRYRLKGGGVVEGRTASDVVEALMMLKGIADPSEQEYMEQVARRCAIYNLTKIDTAGAERFISTLEASGFLHPQVEESDSCA